MPALETTVRTDSAPAVGSTALLDALVAAVNAARYRGPERRGPMTDRYGWPMLYHTADAITWAALQYVLEIESASNDKDRHQTIPPLATTKELSDAGVVRIVMGEAAERSG